jgi:molybdate transport system substrate-binding protein
MSVHVLSGGAAKGIVTALRERFRDETGAAIEGTFSAVGAMRDKFVAGEPCDVLILTPPVIEDLDRRCLLRPGSIAPLGRVRTAVAVPAGFPSPDISTTAAFAAAMRAARGVYIPDPDLSTAGIYFMSVLRKTGLEAEVAPKLRAFPNGETAMAHLAEDREADTIGCTQMTEIKLTKGLTLIGPLPEDHDLATLYVVAISARAADPERAQKLVALLTGPQTSDMRRACGFEI